MKAYITRFVCLTFSLVAFLATALQAQFATTDTLTEIMLYYEMPAVKVLGEKPRLLGQVPGSASYVSPATMRSIQPITAGEVFRTVSGLHVVDEEGIGMRTNIGIRGLDPDRSSKVLVLEDGIPVALNPFGEPQMYYSPTIDRMESLEILKGSGQIQFGPQTIGGVINYITADPPKSSQLRAKVTGGRDGYFSSLIGYGNTVGKTGFRIDYLRKQADNLGPTWFRINDLTAKLKTQLSDRSSIGLKLGFYDELSNATYVGITQAMYDASGQDFARLVPDDRLDVRRLSASLNHSYRWNDQLRLKTTAFAYTTTRNWQRQDFSYSPTASNLTGVVWGDETVPGGAIYLRNSNGHRNRQFEVAGLESRLTVDHKIGQLDHQLETGARILYERAFEQRVNGQKADARSGDLRSDEIRTGHSLSAFVQEKSHLSDRFTLTFGLRAEDYSYERNILRADYQDTSIISDSRIFQLIPGAGLNYTVREDLTVFAGIHRGFAPPRVKDAIANDGTVYNLDPELSWNSELGLRSRVGEWLDVELTAYYMDFSNQIIPISESSGGNGSGLINGGSTLHQGLEAGGKLELGQWLLPAEHELQLSGQITYVRSRYDEDRFLEDGDDRINIKGNRTPYAPEWITSTSLTYQAPSGLGLRLTGNYVGEQFTDELNTVQASANGRTGKLDAYFVLDAGVQYTLPKQDVTFSIAVKNLTDERYIVTRRPQGIRVGLPRFVTFGASYGFNR